MLQPSQLPMDSDNEKCFWSGTPLETTRMLESVVTLPDVATTRTEVGVVPLDTSVLTVPSAAEMPLVGDKVRPPVVAVCPAVSANEKLTLCPVIAAPLASITLNVTVENSGRPGPPVPFNAIFALLTPTNMSEAADAGCTVIVPVLVMVPAGVVAVAVMMSATPHPLSV